MYKLIYRKFEKRWAHVFQIYQMRSISILSQSQSQSFVPLDQRSENESSGSNHFSHAHRCRLRTAQLLPELSFSYRWSRGTKLWERDWSSPVLSIFVPCWLSNVLLEFSYSFELWPSPFNIIIVTVLVLVNAVAYIIVIVIAIVIVIIISVIVIDYISI